MLSPSGRYRLNLQGPFQLFAPSGERIVLSSRKGMALIAMLATARNGERTRAWLQDRLWGRRQHQEAQGSLRRELSSLRRILNRTAPAILVCEHAIVRLNLDVVDVDHRSPGRNGAASADGAHDFLEGLDVPGEDGFEEWLREQRLGQGGAARAGLDRGTGAANRQGGGSAAAAATLEPLAHTFKDRPALAVLAIANLTSDPNNDYLCEAVGEELIELLSRLRWLPVIARSSSFPSAASEADRAAISRRLDARYIFEGRLRKGPAGFVLSVSLSDIAAHVTLWSQRLDLPSPFSPENVDPLVSALVAALDTRIDRAEQTRARKGRPNAHDVNDLIWRGRWHLNRFSREDGERAHSLFAQALALDPDSPEAMVQAALCLCFSVWAQRQSDEKIGEMRRLAQRAMLADPDDGRAYMLAGMAEMWLRRPALAEELLSKAIELNPSLALAHAERGSCRMLAGDPEEGMRDLAMAMRLSPNDMHVFYPLGEMAMAHCMRRDWAAAVEWADRALMRRSGYWYAQMVRIVALFEAGHAGDARRALAELVAHKPDFSPRFVEWLPFTARRWTDYFVDVLTRVGEEVEPASGSPGPVPP